MAENDNPFGTPAAEGADDNFALDNLPEDKGFRIKAGKYPAKLVSLDKSNSKAGNPMWVFTFALVVGEFAGRDFKVYCALTPSALWKLRETLEGLGLGKAGQPVAFKKAEAVGKLAMLTIEDSEYNGRPTSQIALVSPLTPDEAKAAEEGAKALANAKTDIPF